MHRALFFVLLLVFTGFSCNQLLGGSSQEPESNTLPKTTETQVMEESNSPEVESSDDMKAMDSEPMVLEEQPVQESNDDVMQEETVAEPISFSGSVLAGSSSPLIEFNEADYKKALASDKVVVLYFFASWCPICKVEFERTKSAFKNLSGDSIVGFRVNFNDNQTTDAEEDVARAQGVAYQHTKVIIKDGQRVLKSPESWTESRYEQELSAYDL